MKKYLFLTLLLLRSASLQAIIYTKADSLKVVELLQNGIKQPRTTIYTLYYAKQLCGLPYVAATLEQDATEPLVVNLRQMDCTTLVENALALALTTQRSQSIRFNDFCNWLERIRYREGKRNGYTSRNHYFTQWINSNEQQGLVLEVKGEKKSSYSPFTAKQTIDLHYMSQHADSYTLLKKNGAEAKKQIAVYEKEVSGKTVRYIPRKLLNKSKKLLGCVHDGDILAIVTKKDGLDVAHVGIAAWGKDGKLHLLNASSIHHKVVLEPMTLYTYMGKHSSQLGIRVVRPL